MEVHVARQPIFDSAKQVIGYELLFRNGEDDFFPGMDADQATADVINSSFLLKVVDDFLHVRRESIEIGLEVLPQTCLIRGAAQVFQREARGVVEVLPCGTAQRAILVRDARAVQRLLHFDHCVASWFKHAVESPQDSERQNNIAILTAHVQVAKHIIGNAPDQGDDPCVIDRTVHQ